MLKTDSRVEYCHSQSIASFLMVPTDLVMALDFTIVHPTWSIRSAYWFEKNY